MITHVARTDIGAVTVSTIFGPVGLDGKGHPVVEFETLAWRGVLDWEAGHSRDELEGGRDATRQQALARHAALVIKYGMEQGALASSKARPTPPLTRSGQP